MTDKKLTRAINELKRSDQVIQSLCPKGYIHPVLGSIHAAIADFQEALAQPEQEPVAWLLTDKNINSIQVDSIQRLINRLNHAHHTDIRVRINGQDEWFEADWLKHMVRATPPQRTWVGLTLEQYIAINCSCTTVDQAVGSTERQLKENNTRHTR